MLRCRRVEQRGEDAGFDVTRQQRIEDRLGCRLELVTRAHGAVFGFGRLAVAAGHDLALERDQRTTYDFLAAGADEARVDELHHVELLGQEIGRHDLADRPRVFVARLVREPREGVINVEVAVPEKALGLPPDDDERVVTTEFGLLVHRAFGGANHRRVVRATLPAVRSDNDVCHPTDLRTRCQQGTRNTATGRAEVTDDLGDVIAVGNRRVHRLLRLDDPTARDEFHRARDLLRRLHTRDAPLENPLLTTRHLNHSVSRVLAEWASPRASASASSSGAPVDAAAEPSPCWATKLALKSSTA